MVSINLFGSGQQTSAPPQSQNANNQQETNKTGNATQPATPQKETNQQVSKPVEESSSTQFVSVRPERSEVTASVVASRLSTAADEFATARAQAQRVSNELVAEGFIEAISTRPEVASIAGDTDKSVSAPDETTNATAEKAEEAFAQTRQINQAENSSSVKISL